MHASAASGPPKHMRHVGLKLFASRLCRKLAFEATFSWHLPQCRVGEPRLCRVQTPKRGPCNAIRPLRDSRSSTLQVVTPGLVPAMAMW
jgi:hypothetical protein